MTRQQNKANNKNIVYIICTIICIIIEIAAVIGAYAANYFTKTRMGMMRHVIYLNGKWEKLINISVLKIIILLIITALIVLACVLYKKKIFHTITTKVLTVLTLFINLWTMYFIIFFNKEINRAYYIMSICFVLMTLLQNIMYLCNYLVKAKTNK